VWYELDDVVLGVNYYGAELWKLINLNFYHDLDIEKCGQLYSFYGDLLFDHLKQSRIT